ncbi:MAG: hypothetical protein KAH30_04515 [Caldisericia bacterium]|nr:hypothetical protein [Caldisericia bacterium]
MAKTKSTPEAEPEIIESDEIDPQPDPDVVAPIVEEEVIITQGDGWKIIKN